MDEKKTRGELMLENCVHLEMNLTKSFDENDKSTVYYVYFLGPIEINDLWKRNEFKYGLR